MDSSPTQTSSRRSSRERLLMTEMDSLEEPREKNVRLDGKQYITQSTHRYLDQPNNSEDVVEARSSPSQSFQPNRLDHNDATSTSPTVPVYKVYKRRFLGLLQLTLLNIIVSWDWLTFAPVSTSSASYFAVSETAINWLSTAFLFAFVVATPAVIWILNRGGPKPAIVVASGLILAGNWIRYAGSRAREEGAGRGGYGMVMFGQILIGLAQPFVLSAPTRYSDLWFTEKGRISATAVASLANPLGGAVRICLLKLTYAIKEKYLAHSGFPARPAHRPSLGSRALGCAEHGALRCNHCASPSFLFASSIFRTV